MKRCQRGNTHILRTQEKTLIKAQIATMSRTKEKMMESARKKFKLRFKTNEINDSH